MGSAAWFPDQIEGELVVLRKHVADNVTAFQRWYSDPEVARLARYQDTPMRPDEIDRFFQLRALGTESLTMAIHDRETSRLIGSCAFSQVDGENGSAMYHITIGEKDVWGRGYGTEVTQLMLDHAFGTLGLHRVALTVFEFNERAIRAYRNCGFVVEGRSRESIWRDGRWWDELAMSVLSTEWHERRNVAGLAASAGDVARAATSASAARRASTPAARAVR
ncbi:MAG TPA: GNAT family protein [Candidatus Limnocylindria bacterium]|nr:GNAT family protein [Candidatus Limnocylindria bacterium]